MNYQGNSIYFALWSIFIHLQSSKDILQKSYFRVIKKDVVAIQVVFKQFSDNDFKICFEKWIESRDYCVLSKRENSLLYEANSHSHLWKWRHSFLLDLIDTICWTLFVYDGYASKLCFFWVLMYSTNCTLCSI